jgi:EthD domain-containing protein
MLTVYKNIFYCLFLGSLLLKTSIQSRAQTKKDEPFTIENYYKIKWGYADEFIDLWKKNHYPLLKKAQEKGDIIRVTAEKPKLHSGEDTRWDFKVTIVFKNAELAFDANLTTPYKQQLYPDLDKLAKDEQHRFELLLAHWDVMTENVELK